MMGRPPHGTGKDALKAVLTHVPIRLIVWLDRRAELLGLNRSALVRLALEDYRERQSDKRPRKD